ncbi:MAG: hypothetical protein HQM02_11725, partial [Magnetococcales bacterium]|nr:hypothetical protein [Magnetococcales bacterium]
MNMLFVLTVLLSLFAGQGLCAPPMTAYTPIWKSEQISPEHTETVIGLLNEELNAIPGEVVDESPEGRRRTALKNRVVLLRQLGETLNRRRELQQVRPDKGRSEVELDARIRDWEKKPPPIPPAEPNQEAFKTLVEKRAERLGALKTLQETRDSRRQLVQ